VREVTAAQQGQRDRLVVKIFGATRGQIHSRGGDRLGHRAGPWWAFDNTGLLELVYQDTRYIAFRELRLHARDGQLPRPHVDNILMGVCGLARRGFHPSAATVEQTLRSANDAASELARWRGAGFKEVFDTVDQRIVYETVAAQAPFAGPDGQVRLAVGNNAEHIFPGGPRHVFAQQILADGATRWLAGRECLWWGLMFFVQTEVDAGRLSAIERWRQLEQAEGIDPVRSGGSCTHSLSG
jgi:hypothetical protein